jgi:hypothetical protein
MNQTPYKRSNRDVRYFGKVRDGEELDEISLMQKEEESATPSQQDEHDDFFRKK